jgi:uncharacterized repeat protein (TIGR01451 family)
LKRSTKVVLLAVLSLLLLGPLPNSLAGAPRPRLRAPSGSAAIKALDVAPATSAGYGTGTILHADALRAGQHALVDLDVAFSGAAYSSAAAADEVTNEVHRVVSDKLGANAGFGRGTALELGIGSDPIPLIGQLSKAAAPPSTNLIEKVIGPLGVPGVLTAELLRSQAQARSAANACVLGKDQAYGLGSVLDLEVLGGLLSTVARPPRREVSQSASSTRIVNGSTPGRLGLKSETRQTIAPVTFFHGSPFQFTVEVLGEWALRAVADGAKGTVHYGPLAASPETPIARVLDAKGKVLGQLTTQMLLGNNGLEIVIPGVAEIVIGEDPRAIGGDASSKAIVQDTAVAAAADVVRVKLIGGTLADVRIGHMEASVNVPSGGVQCPGITVDQTVDPPTVTPGDEFEYTIVITNPNDCTLENVKVVQTLTATAGTTYELVSMTPSGGTLAGGVATYPDLGPLAPGQTKTVKIKVKIPAGSAPGKLTAVAVVTGVCPEENQPALDPGGPTTPTAPTIPSGDIPVRGEDTLEGPTVGVCVVDDLDGMTIAEAKAALEKAGCILGTVTVRPPADPEDDTPTDVGKVVDQSIPLNTSVPLGTPVDITVNGPLCTVPSLSGLTPAQAEAELVKAGCKLGDVTTGPPNGGPDDAGEVTTQTPPAGDKVPLGTEVDVTINPPGPCIVPDLTGKDQAGAAAALLAAGCILGDVTVGPDNPDNAGKVTDQEKPAGTSVPKGTEIDITVAGPAGPRIETSVLGQTATLTPAAPAPASGSDAAPALARTGGVALGGLALWLMVSGVLTRGAGSRRLWNLFRRR